MPVRWVGIVLGWNVITILLGALVRATHSGAGCGRSWPACSGVVVPDLQGATAIEFTHRAASGVAIVGVIAVAFAVRRHSAKGHPARRSAALAVAAIVLEALIGAAIVLYEWVGRDDSIARAVAVPLHLVNTLLLLAALTLTVWFLSGGGPLRRRGADRRWVLAAGVSLVAISATGAVTALADTLFPVGQEASAQAVHLLTELRVAHPVLAVLALLAMALASRGQSILASATGRWIVILTGAQFAVGALNIRFGTPLVLQLVHLLIADLIWITFVWLAAQLLSSSDASVSGELVGARQTMPEHR
ncbi:MAG TPA: COX15/CtaA family protein [Acidimicrobiia bacterium]|nr:COX15/CtaA family protein [Acidimicrobiia bacterium]